MIRALILFTEQSLVKNQAHPAELKKLIEAELPGELQIDSATYSDLVFTIDGADTCVQIASNQLDLTAYDIISMRRIQENAAEAMAVGKYCLAKGIPMLDEAMAKRPGSMNKLTQYLQFAFAGIPIPATLYSSSAPNLLAICKAKDISYPVIVKAAGGSRGSNNHLVNSLEELETVLSEPVDSAYMVQQHIPNNGDYRVWVCGDQIGPILWRSRTEGHLNNTSLGGSAELVEASLLPKAALDDCIRATSLLDRDVAGVDVVFENDDHEGAYYFFESNRSPQIEGTPFQELKAHAYGAYMVAKAKRNKQGPS